MTNKNKHKSDFDVSLEPEKNSLRFTSTILAIPLLFVGIAAQSMVTNVNFLTGSIIFGEAISEECKLVEGDVVVEKNGNLTDITVNAPDSVIQCSSNNVVENEIIDIHFSDPSYSLLYKVTSSLASEIDGNIRVHGGSYIHENHEGINLNGHIETVGDPSASKIELISDKNILVYGAVEALGQHGQKGGTISIVGKQVGLFEDAVVDASGDTGGGDILIGGNYRTWWREKNAFRTFVGEDVQLKADARSSGDGGRIIVWAEDIARFYGEASANGGPISGNGGFIEVSGRRLIRYAGLTDTGAPNGDAGEVLFDPTDITITTSADSNTTGFATGSADETEAFAEDAGTTNFDVTATTGSFWGNTGTITLQATNDITVSNAFNVGTATGQSNVSLVLTARNHLNINAAITTTGTGTITITSDDNFGGGGNITLGSNLQSDGGTITLTDNGGNTYLASNAIIDTESGDDGDGGAVDLRNINIAGSTAGRSLTINTLTSQTNGSGGAIDLGLFADSGGTWVRSLIIDTSSDGSGTAGSVTLHNNISLDDNNSGLAASMSVAGGGDIIISATLTIDTQNGDTASVDGGLINFNNSNMFADSTGFTLTMDTSTTAIGQTGGAVTVDLVDDNTGSNSFLKSFVVNTDAPTDGTINLGGNITVDDVASNNVSLTGLVNLTGSVAIDTNNATNDGNITFAGTIDGGQALVLDSGTGNITVDGTIGGTTAVTSTDFDGATIQLFGLGDADTVGVTGATDVNGTTAITFDGTTYKANQMNFTSTAGANFDMTAGAATTFISSDDSITFNTADISLADGSDLALISVGGAITTLDIRGTSSEDVMINASGGTTNTVSVDVIGTANEINTVALTGSGGVSLGGDITTSDVAGNTMTVTGPATLDAAVTVDTNNTTHDGNITFSSTIDDVDGVSPFDLVLDAGSAIIDINGAVGATNVLGNLTITSGNSSADFASTVSVANFTVVGGSTVLNGDLTLSGNFVLTAGSVNANATNISVAGNWTTGGTFTAGTSTVTLNGAVAQTITGATSWNNLTIANTHATPNDTNDVDPDAVQTVAGTLSVSDGQWSSFTGDDYAAVTIGPNGIIDPDVAASIMASGAWTNSGTFTAGTSTVTLDGTNQAITGTSTFYDLTKTVASAAVLTFPAGATTTIANDLTLQGNVGELLSLVSSTPGTAWTINVQGSANVEYLSVADSTAVSSISCATGCVNAGGNTIWIFPRGSGRVTGRMRREGNAGSGSTSSLPFVRDDSSNGGSGSRDSSRNSGSDNNGSDNSGTDPVLVEQAEVNDVFYTVPANYTPRAKLTLKAKRLIQKEFAGRNETWLWAKPFIEKMLELKIVKGYPDGMFHAERNINRAEFVKMVVEVFGIPIASVTVNPFSDVRSDTWFAPYVAAAKEGGYVAGYSDGTFRPDKSVNRAEAMVIISKIAGFDLSSMQLNRFFNDVPTNEWFAPAVYYAVRYKIVNGISVIKFDSISPLERGQMVKIITNVLYHKGDSRVFVPAGGDNISGSIFDNGERWQDDSRIISVLVALLILGAVGVVAWWRGQGKHSHQSGKKNN